MAKTMAERQAEYRARMLLRADLFEAANDARQRALQARFEELGDPKTPEERYARKYFMNNPLCFNFPSMGEMLDHEGNPSPTLGAWFGSRPDERDVAAWFLAIREISSIPLWADWGLGDGAGGGASSVEGLDDKNAARVVQEMTDTLRRTGLWGA